MSKLTDVGKKLEVSLNGVQKILIERAERVDIENRELRTEILRLEDIVSNLIKIIGEGIFAKDKK